MALKALVYNLTKEKKGEVSLPSFFKMRVDRGLLHRYLLYLESATKLALAKTKSRGEVAGGGRKPWRQKGTGRARQGSIRAPQWRGGGVVFGPTNLKNPRLKMNKKEKKKALMMAFISQFNKGKVIIVEDFFPKSHKTKEFLKTILPIKESKSLLLIVKEISPELFLASRNLPDVKAVSFKSLNFFDLFNFDKIAITKLALEEVAKDWLEIAEDVQKEEFLEIEGAKEDKRESKKEPDSNAKVTFPISKEKEQ